MVQLLALCLGSTSGLRVCQCFFSALLTSLVLCQCSASVLPVLCQFSASSLLALCQCSAGPTQFGIQLCPKQLRHGHLPDTSHHHLVIKIVCICICKCICVRILTCICICICICIDTHEPIEATEARAPAGHLASSSYYQDLIPYSSVYLYLYLYEFHTHLVREAPV